MATENIPSRLHCVAEGNVLAGANEILDDDKGKKQTVINQENDQRLETLETAVGTGGSVDSRIESAKTEIVGGASSDCNTLGKAEALISTNANDIAALHEAYAALTQNDVVVVAPADTWPVATPAQNIIYRVVDRTNTPPQYYADYMWNGTALVEMAQYNNAIDARPKKASQNLVTSGGVFDNMGALDVSELNATENPHTLAKYVDLSAALAAVPTDYQKGGMSIKFVQSSDNKYVQYRLTANEFTTDVNYWQIMDLNPLNREVFGNFTKALTWTPGYVNYQGNVVSSTLSQFTQPFLLRKGETVIIGTTNTNTTIIGTTQSDSISVGDSVTPIQRTSSTERYEEYSYTAQADIKIVLCVKKSDYNCSFYNANNSSYMLNNMDDEPTEDSQMLVKSGGVYNAIVGGNGYTKYATSVVSGQLKVIVNKNADFGNNIAIRLKSMTSSFASGKSISVSLYKSNGQTTYTSLSYDGEINKKNAGDGVSFIGIYIAANSDVFATSGDIEIEVFWGNGYYSLIATPDNISKIAELQLSQNSDGRELINNSLIVRGATGNQLIGQITKSFGSTNNIAIRIVYNNATLGAGCVIKAYLYSNGSAFASITLSNDWKIWGSSSADTLVDTIRITCEGEVTNVGDVCVEVAYGDYFRAAYHPIIEDFGTIALEGKSQSHPDGTAITKMFNHPLRLGEFSKILVKSSEFILGDGADNHPSIYVYGVFSSDGQKKELLPSFSKNGKISPVYTYDYKYLYGIYFWNNCGYSISFDATVLFEDSISNIPSIVPFDNCLQLPIYYDNYLQERKKMIRSLLRRNAINGDAFYFVTDTHWEYNQRNSPAIINALSELCIPRIFHGGDMYHRGLELDKYNTKCLESYRKALGSNRVYEVDGNHEYYGGIANCGDVFTETRLLLDDVVYGGENKNYYYLDNKPNKVRYICLYVYENEGNGLTDRGFCDETQMLWFKDVALNVDAGYSIFVFAHFIYTRRPAELPGGQYGEIPMLDASSNLNFYRIIDEYSGNGNIVACITGHTHYDCISQNKCKCPIICTTSDHNYPFYQTISGGGSFYDFMDLLEPRDSGTIKEQALDITVYDKDNSFLHLVRIGSRAMNRSNAFDGDAQVDIRTIVLTSVETGNTITLSSEFVIATWETSDSSVASVSDGVVTANGSGYVVITGTASDGKKQSWFIKVAS